MLIYDEWSDVKTTNELYEDIADMYKNEHGFEALNSSSYCGLYFSKDKSYGIQWGPYTNSCKLVINGETVQLSSSIDSKGYKYYIKKNGEMLITSMSSGGGCVQIGVGKTSDGEWGAIFLAHNNQTSELCDPVITTGKNVTGKTPHYVTNYNTHSNQYLAIRHCVIQTNVTFENIYINTHGYVGSWSKFDLNGEQYVAGSDGTGCHDILIMKL